MTPSPDDLERVARALETLGAKRTGVPDHLIADIVDRNWRDQIEDAAAPRLDQAGENQT